MVQNAQITLDLCLCVPKTLDAARVLLDLRLEVGGCALIHAIEDNDIALVHHARVVNRHFPTPSIPK